MIELQPGTQIANYRIVRRLGGGGMGVVYEARHIALDTRFALKMFTLEGEDVDFLKKRFVQEGKLLAHLRHPRLVRVYDLAVDAATGAPYFTMDLVLGPDGRPTTLEDVRRAGRAREADVARWYADLQEGIAAVHAAGIVHRDVKLENVLLAADGHVVLSDFGISRILSEGAGKKLGLGTTGFHKTPKGTCVLGTSGYLAPEVREGAKATSAADLYALGFLLFRLLTGVWYEPNTDVFDLLAPFDSQWRKVLDALLDPDPAKRQMLPIAIDGMSDVPNESAKTKTGGIFSRGRLMLAGFLVIAATAVMGGWRLGVRASADLSLLPLAGETSLKFVRCPAGTFQMGLKGDHAADSIRREHQVNISRPFWFGKYPVTVAEWEEVMGETVEMTPAMDAIGKSRLPMNATKGRFMAFCSNLTERFSGRLPHGYVFRPPTEAEWEYACRGCGSDPDDVYNRFFRDDDCTWLYDGNSQIASEATNHYIWTDESLIALLRARGVTEMPESFTSWSGTRVFGPIGEHTPNSMGIHDLNIGGTGAISLDSVDPSRMGTADYGYGPGQTALAYADEETDPVRQDGTNSEAFIQLVFARGTHKMPMISGASCRNTLRVVIAYDILNAKAYRGFRGHFR